VTGWQLFCAIHFADALVVLGPKCRSVDCLAPARFAVWWPGPGPIQCCARCTAGWQRAAAAMGFAPSVQELHYTTGEDDAVQRFRNMELE
jgi:uncharacterized protein (DUF2237 family)